MFGKFSTAIGIALDWTNLSLLRRSDLIVERHADRPYMLRQWSTVTLATIGLCLYHVPHAAFVSGMFFGAAGIVAISAVSLERHRTARFAERAGPR